MLANTLLFDEEFGGYSPQLEHFLQVVRGEENPSISGLDGYRAIELISATHLAIANSAPIALPLDPARGDHEIATIRARW